MSELVVDLFVEDEAQEFYIDALTRVLVRENGHSSTLRPICNRGGIPAVEAAVRRHLRDLEKGGLVARPDLMIIARDCDGSSAAETRRLLLQLIGSAQPCHIALACPAPSIETWYLQDDQAFLAAVGHPVVRGSSQGSDLKEVLRLSLSAAGYVPALSPYEIADDLVAATNAFRAGKNDPGFKMFVADVRNAVRQTFP